MIQPTHTHRRADRGTLIVRASVVAVGLAASMGLLLWESEPQGVASWPAGNPSVLCTLDANGSFGFQ
jgi:hypothetical protein